MDLAHTDLNIMKLEYNQKNFWPSFAAFVVGFIRPKYRNRGSKQNLAGRSVKQAILVFMALTLTGCGIAYQTSYVRDDASVNIRVVQLTPETVLEANRLAYTPQSWPTAFVSIEELKNSEKNDKTRGPVFDPQRLDGVIEWRMPDSEPLTYIIGVGDVLTLNMQLKESLGDVLNGLVESQSSQRGFRVQDDGAVSIPDIGRVVIGGLTLNEAESTVYQHLLAAGVSPSFSIEITEFNSQKISVSGSVKSPGVLPLTLQPLYLDEAIYESGGFGISDASFIIVRLYRNGSIYQIFGPELYNQSNANRILLKDGDTIIVDVTDKYDRILGLREQAEARKLDQIETQTRIKANNASSLLSRMQYGSIPREYVYIIGEVFQQSRYTLPFEHNAYLADALVESSGGVSSLTGNPKQIYVLRGAADLKNFAPITALHLDTTNAANFLLATRLELRPKDVVFVGTQPITNWNRMIQQILPSLGLPNINIPTID